jgi:hypothetical protein
MRPICFLFTGFLLLSALAQAAAGAANSPLWLYEGSWRVTKNGAPGKPDELINRCAQFSKYFACEQTVNGGVSALIVFVPTNTPGQYRTQSIMPDGRGGGLGELTINGNTWTYSNTWSQGGGKVIYYRTLNVFSGKDRIHFEQQESADNKDWKTNASGDEVRTAPGGTVIAR